MARKKRFELVLSDEEYAEIEEASKASKISKGAYVRGRLFGPVTIEPRDFTSELERLGVKPPVSDKRFKQEVARLQSRMSVPEAEAKARERLGMEG